MVGDGVYFQSRGTSYDILIFEPDAVTDEDLLQQRGQVSRWGEPRDYDTTEGSIPTIRAFYRDLIWALPLFNGPDALSDAEFEGREEQGLPVADYTIGVDYIYIGAGRLDVNALVKIVGQMAWTQRLVVAYVSEDSPIFRPQRRGADAESRAFGLASDPAPALAATKQYMQNLCHIPVS